LGPFLIKVEPEEFREEVVEPPARIPPPVSILLWNSWFQPSVNVTIPFQDICILQIEQVMEEEENLSFHSCEEKYF
jgi:hypothetical protein